MAGSCSFREAWLSDSEFKVWVEKLEGNSKAAFCRLCKTKVHVASMGVGALRSHMKGDYLFEFLYHSESVSEALT